MIVQRLLCIRMYYVHVFAIHLCIVSFTFCLFDNTICNWLGILDNRGIVAFEIASKNKELNYLCCSLFVYVFISLILDIWLCLQTKDIHFYSYNYMDECLKWLKLSFMCYYFFAVDLSILKNIYICSYLTTFILDMLSACFASYSDMLVVTSVISRFVVYVFHIHFTLQQIICIHKQEVLKELIAFFPLMLHGPRRELKRPKFFRCCSCVYCRGVVVIQLLPNRERGYAYIYTQIKWRDLWSTPLRWVLCQYQIQTFNGW
jgi:hypothetical protein